MTALWPGHAAAVVRVVATTTDVGEVVRQVGGTRIELQVLAKGYFDPHHLEAKPSYMASLRKADLLVYNGLQLEVGWLPLVIEGSRNREIAFGGPGHLDLSRGIRVLEVPEGGLSRAEGDIHPEGNPHYTLDPRNLLVMAKSAEAALSRLDPSGAPEYARNRADFAVRLEKAIAEWETRVAPYRGREVVCYHKQWEYLLDWLGVQVVDYIERKPGIPPTAKHLVELEALVAQRHIPVLLASTFTDDSPVKRIAGKTGATMLVLPAAVGAVEGVDTALALFDHLTARLAAAFAKAEAP
jgi:zinc/manganese transport system substrate-binding protein